MISDLFSSIPFSSVSIERKHRVTEPPTENTALLYIKHYLIRHICNVKNTTHIGYFREVIFSAFNYSSWEKCQ